MLFVRSILPCLFLLLVAGCAVPQRQVRGSLGAAEVWQGRIFVAGDVELPVGARLHILPGTEVIFLPAGADDRHTDHPHFPGSELIVRGTLLAAGSASAPIVFRFADATAPAGSWGGINLMESPSATFRFCRFTQADSAVHSQQSQVRVEDCRFDGNRVGIRFHDSAIVIEGNRLNANGVGIRFHFGAPSISRNQITGNDKGLFITAEPRNYLIEGNDLSGNREASVVLGEEVADDVSMAGNWWGTLDPAVIEAGFFDGRRSDYLGRVRYVPPLPAPPSLEEQWSR